VSPAQLPTYFRFPIVDLHAGLRNWQLAIENRQWYYFVSL
jgi:hypothetical protein